MTSLGKVVTGEIAAPQTKKGWKKVFSVGSKNNKNNSGKVDGQQQKALGLVRGKKKGDSQLSSGGDHNGSLENGGAKGATGTKAGGMNGQRGAGFVGMGQDGVWISRKNFLKT